DRPAHQVLDIEDAAGLVDTYAPLRERKCRPSGDDEQDAQLCQARDDVVGEPVGDACSTPGYAVDERHHRHRCATTTWIARGWRRRGWLERDCRSGDAPCRGA